MTRLVGVGVGGEQGEAGAVGPSIVTEPVGGLGAEHELALAAPRRVPHEHRDAISDPLELGRRAVTSEGLDGDRARGAPLDALEHSGQGLHRDPRILLLTGCHFESRYQFPCQ